MELEARDQPEHLRHALTNRVRSYSAELRRLAKDYGSIKSRGATGGRGMGRVVVRVESEECGVG